VSEIIHCGGGVNFRNQGNEGVVSGLQINYTIEEIKA
jgi:hypothetical protein